MKRKMKDPLWKRLPRELVGDIGKYLVIFLFMTASIGFVSGFLVADKSMLDAYRESFPKYNIENGNFTLDSQATEEKTGRAGTGRGDDLRKTSIWMSRWMWIRMVRKTGPFVFSKNREESESGLPDERRVSCKNG